MTSNSSRPRRPVRLAVLAALALAVAGAPASVARTADPLVPLTGVLPSWATTSARVGDVADEALVDIQLTLPWRDAAAARRLALDVSRPSSPSYRDYVTPAAFRERFAPAPSTVTAAQAWLRAGGLTLGTVPSNRMYVPARGTAAQLERMFNTTLGRYRLRQRTLRAPDSTPTIPAAIARMVIGVRGLADEPVVIGGEEARDPFPVPLPDMPATPADSAPPPAVVYAAPCSPYDGARVERRLPKAHGRLQPAVVCETTVAQQRAVYGVDAALKARNDGRGQGIVIVGSHAIQTLPGDVNAWSKRRGIPALKPGQLTQLSYPTAYQTPNVEPILRPAVWSLQAHMLIENIHAMAPGADIVYLGTTSSLDLANGTTLAVNAKLGDIVMNGWYSAGENTNPASIGQISQSAEQAAATGISLLFAAGSIGDTTASGGQPSPVYPANDPMVTAVGGTSLIFGRGGRLLREVGWAKTVANLEDGVWEDDLESTFRGSGGGVSAVHEQPDYQQGVVPDSLARRDDDTFGRTVPDIAVNADAETGITIGLTQTFPDGKKRYAERRHASGESSTAIFAALLALSNQRRGVSAGFVNPALYALRTTQPSAYRDIVPSRVRGHAGVRTDHVDGATAADGVKKVLKTFEAYQTNVPARGYDTSTGVGAPSPRWLSLLR
ncbi:MAG TPA: protease pro-enzyme activation domain-containing protein [Mycobacteriales bacterium]|nr:protease pro-enzyme activation domain-containing protein [Mycobacteriales bacterium]